MTINIINQFFDTFWSIGDLIRHHLVSDIPLFGLHQADITSASYLDITMRMTMK